MQYIDPERCGGRRIKRFFCRDSNQGNREYERILDEYVERLSDAVFNIRMLYDDTVLIGGELGEYADYFIEKVWGILDSQDIYREESAKDYVKVCEDGENVIAIGAANVLYQSGDSQIVKESKRSRRKKDDRIRNQGTDV